MFSFLTEYIGYSASAAQRRIEAARFLRAVPEVKEDIKSGSINLSQVALVAQSIRQKQKEMPDVQIKATDKKVLLESIKSQNFEISQKIISQTLDLEIKDVDKKKVQKDESVRLEVTFSKEQMEVFNKVKALMSHVNPNATFAEIFEHLAKDYLKRKDLCIAKVVGTYTEDKPNEKLNNLEFGPAAKRPVTDSVIDVKIIQPLFMKSNQSVSKKPVQRSIHQNNSRNPSSNSSDLNIPNKRKPLSVKTKRLIWTRDQGTCQHFSPTTNKICGSSFLLEIDHIKRVSHGGDNHANNLRLLCKAHNLWRG